MARTVNRHSAIPYYIQVKEALQERVQQGEWQPGDQIPGEPELCRIFNVSRTVVRQALSDLMHEGLIRREKGKGTFIAEPKISGGLVQRLTGSYQDMMAQGYTLVTQVLKQELVPAKPKVAGYLKIAPDTPVIEIERLRFIQNEPLLLVTTYLPYALCAPVLNEDLTNQSLYVVLEKRCGHTLAYGQRTIEAVPANEYESSLLGIKKGAPLILLNSVTYLKDGTPIEYYHALHRGDRSRFEVRVVQMQNQGDVTEIIRGIPGSAPTSNQVKDINQT